MNLKNNKGITLLALIITIIVILIIAGITIYGGSNLIKEVEAEDVKTNMLLIQAEVKNFAEQAKFENKTVEDFETGITIEGNEEGVTSKLVLQKTDIIDGAQFYKIDSLNSENINIPNTIDTNIYYVFISADDSGNIGMYDDEKKTYDIRVEVYFEPGIPDPDGEGTKHYLSEIEM